MNFNLNGSTIFAHIRFDDIRGEKALGFSRLSLRFEFHIVSMPKLDQGTDDTSTTLTDLCGDLLIGSDFVGQLVPRDPPLTIRAFRAGPSQPATLVMELDPRRIETIEDRRLGGDLKFDIVLRGVVKGGGKVERVEERGTIPIEQSKWIEVLKGFGHERIMLLEVPMPDSSSSSRFSETMQYLSSANRSLLTGDWRGAVGCCRDVLESLSLARGCRGRKKRHDQE